MANKVRVGHVFEIETPIGLVYAQFYHEDAVLGELIRVLPGIFERQPDDLARLTAGPDRFVVFYPVRTAVRQGLVRVAGFEPIPNRSKPFPLMLKGGLTDKDGATSSWWLYEDGRDRRLSELRPEHRSLPIAINLGHPGLVNAIVNDWQPSDEFDGNVGFRKLPDQMPS